MRIALCVPRLRREARSNLDAIERMTGELAGGWARLVVFSEAALTDFTGTGDAEHDLALECSIPGPETGELSRIAARNGVWLALGLYERERNCLYY